MAIEQLLLQLGLNISANAIYDFFRVSFSKSKDINVGELKKELVSFLNIKNADIIAERIINFLAVNGDIEIKGSRVFAKNSILYSSGRNTKFSLEESRSETEKTRIDVGKGAKIEGQGGAAIKQNEDGSIGFYT